MYAALTLYPQTLPINKYSYLVMELMKTNLQVLSNVRPIEGEFVQYLLYQILVWSSFESLIISF